MSMRNIALILEYDGSLFHGWQSQKNAVAISDVVGAAVANLDKAPARIVGASRTDAGVHAKGQVANFFTESGIPAEKYAYALNAILPAGVVCARSFEVSPDFHSRFSAKGKTYSYLILNKRHPSALYRNRAWHVPLPLDIDAMRSAADLLVGEKDFRAFMSSGSPVNSTVRTIYRLELAVLPYDNYGETPDVICGSAHNSDVTGRAAGETFECAGRFIRLTIEGNGFLYNMARIIAGTLVYVGQDKLNNDDVARALRCGDRRMSGKTAPPQGLCLERVMYNRALCTAR